uniref:Uncharacterized protein n=1 Tax=Syphacia muris TaxID=451379 RepID=A0A0N5B1A2_9BILA
MKLKPRDVCELLAVNSIISYIEENDKNSEALNQQVGVANGGVTGIYIFCWPWHTNGQTFTYTFALRYSRLNALLKQMSEHPDIVDEYDRVFQYQLQQGVIENAIEILDGNELWWHGPAWLSSNRVSKVNRVVEENYSDMPSEKIMTFPESPNYEEIIDLSRKRNWEDLLIHAVNIQLTSFNKIPERQSRHVKF